MILRYLIALSENERLKTEIQALEGKLAKSEARLFAEIDSNRRREDDLTAAIAGLSGARERISRRDPLIEREIPEAGTIEEIETKKEDAIFEAQVKQRVKDFAIEAERRGTPYTDEDKLVIEDRIRENPGDYLAH